MVTFNVCEPVSYRPKNGALVFSIDTNDENTKWYGEGICLSTDTKPLGWANGSKLTEIDTGKNYIYDESGSEWIEVVSGEGGGGSGGGGVTILNVTSQPDSSSSPPSTIYVPDKTYDEIKAAYDGGQAIILNMVNATPVTGVMYFSSEHNCFVMRFGQYEYVYAPDGSFSVVKIS